ncbi:MAG: hypothetical protein ACYDB7_15705 [Mycobacteriales bacterium]
MRVKVMRVKVMSRPRGRLAVAAVAAGALTAVALAGCGASGPSPAQQRAAVTTTWTTFFDPATSLATKQALLQNGAALTPAIALLARNPSAAHLGVRVHSVTVRGTTATVTYDILVSGHVVLANSQGTAVEVGGAWRVSQATFCALADAGTPGGQVPGC